MSSSSLASLVSSNRFGTYFGVPQELLDRVWSNLADPEVNSIAYISMEIGADPDVFHPIKDFLDRENIGQDPNPQLNAYLQKYQCNERKIPNYSGGLGVLAGDTLKSFADLHLPALAISLLYREG